MVALVGLDSEKLLKRKLGVVLLSVGAGVVFGALMEMLGLPFNIVGGIGFGVGILGAIIMFVS